jgi:MurNAc alpha-1-phosphate uridylyltransferase
MVLAAGLGTRMRPFNGRLPKPLVSVGGKALIDYVLDRLAEQGVERAVVNVHHLADQIERHLAQRDRPDIVISDERDELLGTGGGVLKALPLLGESPFFHVNSDTIWIEVAPFVYAGAAILTPGFFAGARPGTFSMSPLFDRAAEAERLCGLRLEGVWMHVGTPEAVKAAEDAILASAA